MCNSLWHPVLRTTGLISEILQKLKLILSKNVVEPSIYTALLSIFPPQSEKNVGVIYVYQKYQIRNLKKEMALKWRFRSFFQPGNSFQTFTKTNLKNIQTKYIKLCLNAILFYDCTGVLVFQTIMLKFELSIE